MSYGLRGWDRVGRPEDPIVSVLVTPPPSAGEIFTETPSADVVLAASIADTAVGVDAPSLATVFVLTDADVAVAVNEPFATFVLTPASVDTLAGQVFNETLTVIWISEGIVSDARTMAESSDLTAILSPTLTDTIPGGIFNEPVTVTATLASSITDAQVCTERPEIENLFIDKFARVDNNNLGQFWVERENDPATLRVLNRVLSTFDDVGIDADGIAFTPAVSDDQFASLRNDATGGGNAPVAGPAVRIDPNSTSSNFTGYQATLEDPFIRLRKYVNQLPGLGGTLLGSYTPTAEELTGQFLLYIDVVGSSIRVKVNNTVRISVTDTTITSGRTGIVSGAVGGELTTGEHTWSEFQSGPLFSLRPTVVEGRAFNEFPSASLIVSLDTTESTAQTETPSPTIVIPSEVTDAIVGGAINETPSASFSLASEITGPGTFVEAQESTSTLTPTDADTASLVDADSLTAVLSPTLTDTILFSEILPFTVSDNFNRPNSSLLGTPWTESETVGIRIEIVSNRVRFSINPNETGFAVALRGETAGDRVSQMTFSSADPTESFEGGVVVRGSGSATTFTGYTFAYSGFLQVLELAKFVNGVGTILASSTVTLAASDVIRLEAVGSRLTAKRNGTTVMTAVDSEVATGKFGIYCEGATQADGVIQEWDDWQGGDTGAFVTTPTLPLVDVGTLQDTLTQTIVLPPAATDALAVTNVFNETPSVAFTVLPSSVDTGVLIDLPSLTILTAVTESDQTTSVEAIILTSILTPTETEQAVRTEEPSVTVVLAVTDLDTAVDLDTLSATVVVAATDADVTTAVNEPSITLVLPSTSADVGVLVEARSETIVVSPTETESLTGVVSVDATVIITPADTDARVLGEFGQVTISSAITSPDAATFVDTTSITGVLPATQVDAQVSTDSLDQTIVLTPTQTDTTQGIFTESPSATLVFVESTLDVGTLGDTPSLIAVLATDSPAAQTALESNEVTVVLSPAEAEGVVRTDTPSITAVLLATQTDTLIAGGQVFNETPNISLVLAAEEQDTRTLTESLSQAVILDPTTAEAGQLADLPSISASLVTTESEGISVTELTPVTAGLATSATELATSVEANLASILGVVTELDTATLLNLPSPTVIITPDQTDTLLGAGINEFPSLSFRLFSQRNK